MTSPTFSVPTVPVGTDPSVDDSLGRIIGLIRAGEPISEEEIVPLLPHGIHEEHALRMRLLLYHLDWEVFSLRKRTLLSEYADRIVLGHVLPIARQSFIPDPEAARWIAFPEDFLDPSAARFYRVHPEKTDRLWCDVCSYFVGRFHEFFRNVHPVSALFNYCRGNLLEAVEQSALSLMSHRMVEFARRGEYSGVVRSVRETEAAVLAAALSASCPA